MSDREGIVSVAEQAVSCQIANAKAQFLESALRLLTPVVQNGDEAVGLAEDIEGLAQDTIDLFATLLRCDKQHNLLAATSEEYPYEATEAQLEELFLRFATVCDRVRELVEALQNRGHEIESRHALEAVCAHAHRLVQDDDTFYETEAFRTLLEEALAEYQTGQV
ncbi:MAG: hypothetical protein ACE5LU_27925, partial [Anaerolineae bacterium]